MLTRRFHFDTGTVDETSLSYSATRLVVVAGT